MAAWRYTARFVSTETKKSLRTRPYTYRLKSEEEGLEKLGGFLVGRRNEFGIRLKWVTLERSESGAHYQSDGDWEEVVRKEA